MVLPVDIDTTYADDGADASVKTHQQHHDEIHAFVNNPFEVLIIPIGDETTALTTGTAKVRFHMPFAMTVTSVRAGLSTGSSSGLPTFDINEGAGAGTSILSTKITIDVSELTSTTAATAPVLSDTALADAAEITVDCDVAGTGAAGAKIYIIGKRA